jgi:RNA polymerase sigma factor (sigma-70 family)
MARLLALVWLLATLLVPEAWGQQPVVVDPYEVLYGKRLLLPQRPIPDFARKPPLELVTLIEARTDLLVTKLSANAAALGRSSSTQGTDNSFAKLASTLSDDRQRIMRMRDQGRPFAAWYVASQDFVVTEFVSGFFNAVIKETLQEKTGGSGSLSRVPELRAKLDAFHARLALIKPQNVGTVLAVLDSYARWVDLTMALDLLQSQPRELLRLFLDGQAPSEENASRLSRWVMEPIFASILDWYLDESEHLLQASMADKSTQTLRIEEGVLRELSRSYLESARTNIKLLELRSEGRKWPKRSDTDESVSRLLSVLLAKQVDYALAHRGDTGLEAALTQLGTSFDAYRSSLAAHDQLEILTAPVVPFDEVRDTYEKAQAATRNALLAERFLTARQAASLTRNASNVVPIPVLLSIQTGEELSDEDVSAKDHALEELTESQAMAQLAVALIAPIPGSASRGSEYVSDPEQEAAVMRCIEELRDRERGVVARALGHAVGRGWRVQGTDLRNLIDQSIVETCTRARFLNENISRYFWRVFKNAYVNWLRDVEVEERGVPKLSQICEDVTPTPADDLLSRESCSLMRRAMGQLSKEEREVLRLSIEEKLSAGDIASQLNISEDAARQRVRRALGKLRQAYKDLDPLSLLFPPLFQPHPRAALAVTTRARTTVQRFSLRYSATESIMEIAAERLLPFMNHMSGTTRPSCKSFIRHAAFSAPS